MLTSLEIRNFRAFPHLVIPQLGHVNLVVGRNNVGKTCLLEALCLYDACGSPAVIEAILANRNEIRIDPVYERAIPMLDMLFHKPAHSEPSFHLSIGPHRITEEESKTLLISGREMTSGRVGHPAVSRNVLSMGGLSIQCGDDAFEVSYQDFFANGHGASQSHGPHAWFGDFPFLTATPVAEGIVAHWWDEIALTDLKDDVIKILQGLDPSIMDVTFVAHPLDPYNRMAMVRTSGRASPIPLRNFGDGVVRLLTLATSIQWRGIWPETGQLGRVLLVDEVENGIHHTFHPHLWKALFRLAEVSDVQIFATTHSWDCVTGFQQAAAEAERSEGKLIRLEAARGNSAAFVFAEGELATVTRGHIEVR